MKDDRIYIAFVLECIADIESYTEGGKAEFLQDKKTQDAVLRKLHTMTESVQRLSPQLKSKYPALDWKSITGFRNIIVHDYLGVDIV